MFIAFVVVLVFDVGLFVWAYRRNQSISKEQRKHQEQIALLEQLHCFDKEDQD
jgi:hypothetical protein